MNLITPMKKFIVLVLSILFLSISGFSQERNKKLYGVFESKTLFQLGLVHDSAGNNVSSVLRFAPFANYSLQMHKDFSNLFGAYIGIGCTNLGFITKYNSSNTTVKSRAYCLGIPIGLKFGNMGKETYFYLGAEFLAQIDYKEKVFQGGEKSRRKNNNDINQINYSGSVGFNMKAFTIGVEYTFNNFYGDNYRLVPQNANPTVSYGTPTKSNILTFFFGFRTNLSAEKASAPEKKIQQAMLHQR